MAVATPNDVEIALGRPLTGDAETSQVSWWLDGTELLIANRLGPVDNLDPTAVRYVEAEAVAAKVRRGGNTETSITATVDDGAVTRRWEAPVSDADITDEWWNLLTPQRDSNAFSTRPGFAPGRRYARPHTRTRF